MKKIVLLVALFTLIISVQAFAQTQDSPLTNAALLMFSAFVGAVGRPIIAWVVSLIKSIPNDVAGAISVLFFALIFLAGWATLGGKGGAPADLISWAQAALNAVGMGSIVMSGVGATKAIQK